MRFHYRNDLSSETGFARYFKDGSLHFPLFFPLFSSCLSPYKKIILNLLPMVKIPQVGVAKRYRYHLREGPILSSWNFANYQFDHWMSSVFYGAFTEWVPHQGTAWIKGSNLFFALMAYWHTSQLNGVKTVTKLIFIRQYF